MPQETKIPIHYLPNRLGTRAICGTTYSAENAWTADAREVTCFACACMLRDKLQPAIMNGPVQTTAAEQMRERIAKQQIILQVLWEHAGDNNYVRGLRDEVVEIVNGWRVILAEIRKSHAHNASDNPFVQAGQILACAGTFSADFNVGARAPHKLTLMLPEGTVEIEATRDVTLSISRIK